MSGPSEREPLMSEAPYYLANACEAAREKRVLAMPVDIGLRAAGLADRIEDYRHGKGRRRGSDGRNGFHGSKFARHPMALPNPIQPLGTGHCPGLGTLGVMPHTMQFPVKGIANRACISRPGSSRARYVCAAVAFQGGI
jgi:hypothetical protein